MENKNCRDCKYFSRYYTKEEKKFERTKCGWCCKEGKTVNNGEGCEKFEQAENDIKCLMEYFAEEKQPAE